MNNQEFEKLIQLERSRSLPSCPPSMEASVLRRIRLQATEADWTIGFKWMLALPRSGLVLGTLALTVLLSSLTSIAVISSYNSSLANSDNAMAALDFQIFKEVQVLHLDD